MKSAIGPIKSSENLLPRSKLKNPKVISIARGLIVRQADLDFCVALAFEIEEATREWAQRREKILKAVEAGAAVESGALTARMKWNDILECSMLHIERRPSSRRRRGGTLEPRQG
jgi:hypothetical protein